MAFLGDTPHLDTVSPFATQPTIVESKVKEIEKGLWTGVGVTIGTVMLGLLWFLFTGRRL